MDEKSVWAESPSLADPATCGEDLNYNLLRALEIAPSLCDLCEDYHILFAAGRLAGRAGRINGLETDRREVSAIVGKLISERAALSRDDPVDIVIAGATDTGILATCAYGAQCADNGLMSRVRFTVLDACDTPLELCRDYATRHGLVVTAEAIDLVDSARSFPADIIVHHSLLRFLSNDCHSRVMMNLRGWLKTGGRIVFSSSLSPPERQGAKQAHRSETNAAIRSMVEVGSIKISEPKASFYARLERSLDRHDERNQRAIMRFARPEQLRDLFHASGLSVVSIQTLSSVSQISGTAPFKRDRLLAVLAA